MCYASLLHCCCNMICVKSSIISGESVNCMEEKHYVYILLCADGTFYTGYTNDLQKRLWQHNNSKEGAKYTSSRRPCKLAYYEEFDNKHDALSREYEIKHKLNREEKMQLISSFNNK